MSVKDVLIVVAEGVFFAAVMALCMALSLF